MKRIFQSYKLFVPLLYRLLIMLGLPILAILNECLGRLVGLRLMAVHAIALPFILIFADSWVMNGICDKRSISLDFVKSSKRGHFVMKAAIWSEMAGRLLLTLIVFIVTGLIGGYPIAAISMGLFTFAMSTIGVTITRHFDSIQVMMIVASLIGSLTSAATSLFYYLWPESLSWPVAGINGWIPFGITLVFAAAIMLASGLYTVGRVEGTYHDSRS